MKINKEKLKGSLREFAAVSFLSIFTALYIAIFFISLPFTENFVAKYSYDLRLKSESYTNESFTVELDKDEIEADQIDEYMDIIRRRLSIAGVERFQISSESKTVEIDKEPDLELIEAEDEPLQEEESDDEIEEEKEVESKEIYVINVETWSILEDYIVQSLLTIDGQVEIYTVKDGVEFDNEEDFLAPYLEENYDKTPIDRDYFRRIIVRESPTSAGGLSYFLVFKPRMAFRDHINEFLTQRQGEMIGVNIAGYIMPYQVGGTDLIVGIGATESDKAMYSAIFSTKPFDFTPTVQREGATENLEEAFVTDEQPVSEPQEKVYPYNFLEGIEKNYEKYTAGFAFFAVLFAIVLGILTKKDPRDKYNSSLIFLFSTTLALSIWLAYLKITASPIDLFTIVVCGGLILVNNFLSAIIHDIDLRIYKFIGLIALSYVIALLGRLLLPEIGFISIIASKFIWVLILSEVVMEIFRLYWGMLKKYMSKGR